VGGEAVCQRGPPGDHPAAEDRVARGRAGGRAQLIGDEPIVVTRLEVAGPHRILEGWHAQTGQLVRWRWSEEE
jgi:hypothetical protein